MLRLSLIRRIRLYSPQISTKSVSRRMSRFPPDIEEAHRAALALGKDTYVDPYTGFTVFTSLAAERRGKCCGRGCRHCPFGHFNVPDAGARKAPLPTKPTLLRTATSSPRRSSLATSARVLFWSGGKDSFLTYLHMIRSGDSDVVLLTTFDGGSGIVPEQDIPMHDVFDQARAIKCDLVAVPAGRGNESYMKSVLDGLKVLEEARKLSKDQVTLYFGDLHLEDIRDWRTQQFNDAGYKCVFPLFKISYPELNKELFGATATSFGCRYFFSAVNNKNVGFGVGDELTKPVMEKLMEANAFDPYGENGEFHTVVRFGAL